MGVSRVILQLGKLFSKTSPYTCNTLILQMFYKVHSRKPIVKIKFMPFKMNDFLKQLQDYISGLIN